MGICAGGPSATTCLLQRPSSRGGSLNGLAQLCTTENRPHTLLGFRFGKTKCMHLCNTLGGFGITHTKHCGCGQTGTALQRGDSTCPEESWLVSRHWGAWAEQNYTCLRASVYAAQPKHTGALKDTSQMSEGATKIQLSKPVRWCCHRKWHFGVFAGTGQKQEDSLILK